MTQSMWNLHLFSLIRWKGQFVFGHRKIYQKGQIKKNKKKSSEEQFNDIGGPILILNTLNSNYIKLLTLCNKAW